VDEPHCGRLTMSATRFCGGLAWIRLR